jgi:glycosyltransferase involved in cell wall biosynthesis
MLPHITPLILTFNEAPNIGRLLASLAWAREILVLDSFSTDATESIARSFPNVQFMRRQFDTFAGQCNWGLERIRTEWVLSLDADYLVTDGLLDEIAHLDVADKTTALIARFRYCIGGRPLRGSLYPPRAVLFRRAKAQYVQDGHAHRLQFDGSARGLQGYMLHDDRKPLSRWLESQRGYARLEAQHLAGRPAASLSVADHLRRSIWPAAPAAFFYTLFVNGCLFDGWRGWFYVLQRTYVELLMSLELLDLRLCRNDQPGTAAKVDEETETNGAIAVSVSKIEVAQKERPAFARDAAAGDARSNASTPD